MFSTARCSDAVVEEEEEVVEGSDPDLLKRSCLGSSSSGDNAFDSQEATFVQLLSYELFPKSDRVLSGFTAGPGRQSFGPSWRHKADCLVRETSDGGASVLTFVNYHGLYTHRAEGCFSTPHRWGCRKGEGSEGPWATEYRGRADDEFKSRLANAMTRAAEAAGVRAVFRYFHVHECELFHSFADFQPSSVGSSVEMSREYRGPRHLLVSKHADRAVFGIKERTFTREGLLKKILSGSYNAEGNTFGGFVVISGGKTRHSEHPADSLGYCLQKRRSEVAELGAFTRLQALHMCDGDVDRAEELLACYAKNDQTSLRGSFGDGPGHAETLNLDYFRHLVKVRGLDGFRVHHFIFFHHNDALSGFLTSMAQERHNLRLTGGSEFRALLLKLVSNSIYGYGCMQSTSFGTTSIAKESYLKVSMAKQLKSERLLQLTLLGATDPAAGYPDLLYALTRSNERKKIRNVIQMSACILSNSKCFFLGVLGDLLLLLDLRKAELSYVDTDSAVFVTAHPALEDCLLSTDEDSRKRLSALFVDNESPVQQGGKLKVEGVYTGLLIRGNKTYNLFGELSPEERRMRGVSRAVQAMLSPDHYGQNCVKNSSVVRTVSIRPTPGFEIVIMEESKTISHSLNFKRVSIDPSHTLPLP